MSPRARSSFPLYRPELERDACGIGLVADPRGRRSHDIIEHALGALVRLTHRGAPAETASVDGSGILAQIPWRLLADDLPAAFSRDRVPRALGTFFLPRRDARELTAMIEQVLRTEGWGAVHWRSVPVCFDAIAPARRRDMPAITQVAALAASSPDSAAEAALNRARVSIETLGIRHRPGGFAIVSLSTRTVVYKGLLTPSELPAFYTDLREPAFESALAIVHQRFSTNTTAQWALAQPFHLLAHNGEISTIAGNRQWAGARLRAAGIPDGNLSGEGASDSCSLDAAALALMSAGYALPHALARLVPPAWEQDRTLHPDAAAFYEYQSRFSEPWDGPAAIAFSDGRIAGALVDRNGFRPARFIRSRDGRLYLGSEAGIFDVPDADIVARGRLAPGGMIVADTTSGAVLDTAAVRLMLAKQHPYRALVSRTIIPTGPPGTPEPTAPAMDERSLVRLQKLFGYSQEEIDLILRPMARDGAEAVGSMGDDAPLAALSAFNRVLPDFFRQRFAQVTNPAMDPLREACVMSLRVLLGAGGNCADETAPQPPVVSLPSPVLDQVTFDCLIRSPLLAPVSLPLHFPAAHGAGALADALDQLALSAVDAAGRGAALIVLSDRGAGADDAPIPPLLGTAAVHRALRAGGVRMSASVVVETGEARDPHQMATLFAYGASAVLPYVAFETVRRLGALEDAREGARRYRAALEHGLLKIFSKMGISTFGGYCGGGLFDVMGLDRALVDKYFPGGGSPLGGLTLSDLGRQLLERHAGAFAPAPAPLGYPGFHSFRRGGESHAYNPSIVRELHRAASTGREQAYRAFNQLVDERPPVTLRDRMRWRAQTTIPLDEVEGVEQVCRRFFSAAMSVGALSPEAHETIGTAMNQLGGRSNSGEGGEAPSRFTRHAAHQWSGSAIKQIASARFGVTPAYLRSADELQIKIAQGSKPGEGGQLPASKVVEFIARLRYAQPGTTLISPPVHHDIYSIEDLAQLIFDLRRFHPAARIGVKLVSAAGVGIVAAGAAKAGADAILISGYDGGTGASPRGSIKHAGLPWELGLAEAHQVLVHHGLRDRVALQVDGGLQRGRDVAIAAALGADEFGFGTAALVAIGCVMARQCHLDTCPAGIATQRRNLRERFTGTPEMLVGYLRLLAGDVRLILASLGVRGVAELVGRADLLETRPGAAPEERLNLEPLLARARASRRSASAGVRVPPSCAVDEFVLPETVGPAAPVLVRGRVRNVDRAVGAALSGQITERFGAPGLPPGSVVLRLTGTAGQSFGAFLVPGVELHLSGEANDYVGKGMHGGTISVRPIEGATVHIDRGEKSGLVLHDAGGGGGRTVLAGNAVLYGATGGHVFIAGSAGERFAVRNSGASAVVEGIGDHGGEYMTGGVVVVLGPTGRNFGSGMSGGVAYLLGEKAATLAHCNRTAVDVRPVGRDDWPVLEALLSRHWKVTGSPAAAVLLAQEPVAAAAAWRKITPTLPRAAATARPLPSRDPRPYRRPRAHQGGA